MLVAEEALAAGDDEGHHHTVALLEPLYARPGLHHDPHEFMAEDVACFGGRNLAAIEVQVGAADGGGSDLQDDVVGFLDDGVGDRFDPHVMGGMVEQCAHGLLLEWAGLASMNIGGKPGKPSRRLGELSAARASSWTMSNSSLAISLLALSVLVSRASTWSLRAARLVASPLDCAGPGLARVGSLDSMAMWFSLGKLREKGKGEKGKGPELPH
jgi:hypothetical protein